MDIIDICIQVWNATATLEFAHFVSSGITKISQQAEFTNSSQLRASETKYMQLEAKQAETAENGGKSIREQTKKRRRGCDKKAESNGTKMHLECMQKGIKPALQ